MTEPPKGDCSEKGTSCLIASVMSLKIPLVFFTNVTVSQLAHNPATPKGQPADNDRYERVFKQRCMYYLLHVTSQLGLSVEKFACWVMSLTNRVVMMI